MATIYIDSNWSGATTGALSSPLNSFSQIAAIIQDGDTLAIKCGRDYRETLPAAAIEKNNLRIVTYGEGSRPRIMGSDRISSWTFDPVYNVYSTNLGSNVGGNITENGIPLTFVAWNTNLATTAPNIPVGGFSFDFNSYTLYMKPAYKIDDIFEVGTRLYGIDGLPSSFKTGMYIEGIEIIGPTRQGMWWHNRGRLEICDVVVRVCGGLKGPSFWLGNGIEINRGSSGGIVRDSLIEDIFDSGISPQIYDPSPYTLLGAIVKNNTIRRCGMGGVEVSTQTATNIISGVRVISNSIEDIGMNNWSGNRGGTAIWTANNGGTAAAATGTLFAYNNIKRCVRGYLSGNSYGVNECRGNLIQDCTRAFYTSKSIASSREQRDIITGNIAINCDEGHYQAGAEIQYTDFWNNTLINCGTGITMTLNSNAVVSAKNNIFKGEGTAFSVSTGTLNESTNYVDFTITPGKTLDGTDMVVSLASFLTELGRLKPPFDTNSLLATGESLNNVHGDFNGKPIYPTPDIGAMQYSPTRTISTRTLSTRTIGTRRINLRIGVVN